MDNLLLKIGAAYIRVSTERQDEYSPDSQLKKIRECAERDGYTIPDEYIFYDDGISGKSTKKRNEFNRMIALAKDKSHPFDVIYVWKFSRFARNQEEAIVYKNLLRKSKVSVVSVSEAIPEGHFGTLVERIIEWMDEFYLINLSTEVVRGMTEKASRGEPICYPAFAYNIKDGMYYPDEQQAPIVQEIFSRYANGDGMRAIAVDLGKRGVRTNRGNTPDNRWIEYILHNPVYIGKIRWSLDGTRAVQKRNYDSDKIMVINGHHTPIIDMSLWERVQTRLKAEKKLHHKYARQEQSCISVMVKGLVKCSSCGSTLSVSSVTSGKAKHPTMQCCAYAHGTCHTSHSVVVPKLEKAIVDGLKQAIASQTFNLSPERKVFKADTPNYDKLISIEEKKLQRAKESYLAEIDTLEQYAENKKTIENNIAELIGAKEKEASSPHFSKDAFSKKVIGVVELIEREDVSTKAKNEALRTILDKIVYNKAEESVSLFFYE